MLRAYDKAHRRGSRRRPHARRADGLADDLHARRQAVHRRGRQQRDDAGRADRLRVAMTKETRRHEGYEGTSTTGPRHVFAHGLRVLLVALRVFVVSLSAREAADIFKAQGGDVTITTFVHSSVQLEHAGKVIQVDPWSVADLVGGEAGGSDPHHRRSRPPPRRQGDRRAPQARRAGRDRRQRTEARARRHRDEERRAARRGGRPRRGCRRVRPHAGRAVPSERRGERLHRHAWRPARLLRRRHRVRAGDPRPEEHRRRVLPDEPAAEAHGAARPPPTASARSGLAWSIPTTTTRTG